MGELKVEVEPQEAGFDAQRLARIDRHFARYVDDGRLPGLAGRSSTRRGQIAHLSTYGQRDVEAGLPVELDTLFRIYSMTKPITSVAAMMLYEEGAFELKDPVSRFIPSFARHRGVPRRARRSTRSRSPRPSRCASGTCSPTRRGSPTASTTPTRSTPCTAPAGFEWGSPPGADLAACCDAWAALPLLFQPGTEWNYGVSTDVLGRVVEVASGQTLDQFFAERIFEPLGMTDTAFLPPKPTTTGSRRSTSPCPAAPTAGAHGRDGRRRQAPAARTSRAAAASSRRPPTTTGSPRCCSTAASSTARACSAPAPCAT